MIRVRLVFVAAALLSLLAPVAHGETATSADACVARVLVLTAMPLELDPLVRAATIDVGRTITVQGRTFYFGTLGGKDVALAMTGIGMANASQTTDAAYALGCPFAATLFDGVAGSKENIGDVTVPDRWTADGGKTWLPADTALVDVARSLAPDGVPLSRVTPVGDAACACPGVDDPGTPVTMPQPLKLVVGGDGTTSDMFSGKAVPCLPGGGDVAGCAPCLPGATAEEAAAFADNAPELADTAFVQGFFQPPPATTDSYEAQDEETAAAAAVAHEHAVPFLGIRAVSDGHGDPLGLPGFPFQFFVYRRLAANNAAAVTEAVLQRLPLP